MIHDAICQHKGVRINGMTKTDTDAQGRSSLAPTLPKICFELQAKVDAFLREETEDDVLRTVQNRVRVSVDVIREALRRYG